ncbi:MAG: hypothetical protein IJE53_04130 [Bacilli bacterium]|nr:hypothetical protein [Bacilli bacterium]
MLDEIIRRDDVSQLLEDICNSARYYDKRSTNSLGYDMYFGVEQILFLFYDALFKYKMIIDDMSYFDDFFEQIDKLIRKIDNFYDISNGINRIIGRICAFKLDIKDVEDEQSKEEVLRYIYDKYMVNGYFIHGYASCYYGNIFENGFYIDQYHHLYDKFIKIQNILNKKKHNKIISKDFNDKKVEFTDSLLLGCYYSANAPMFFSNLLCRNEFIKKQEYLDDYARGDYNACLKNLYRVMNGLKLRDSQKNIFIDAFKSEWKLLDKSNSNISLMLIPRDLFRDSLINIDSFIRDSKNDSFAEAVCKLFNHRTSVVVKDDIMKRHITFVNLDGYKKYVKEEKKDNLKTELEKTFITSDDEFAFSNTYGKVSILLLVGTMLIAVGVILTMLMFS